MKVAESAALLNHNRKRFMYRERNDKAKTRSLKIILTRNLRQITTIYNRALFLLKSAAMSSTYERVVLNRTTNIKASAKGQIIRAKDRNTSILAGTISCHAWNPGVRSKCTFY